MPPTPHESPVETVLAYLDAHRPAERTLPVVRAYLDQMLAMEPAPADVTAASIDLGGVHAELLTPTRSDSDGALLYLHGGGYCFGTAAGYRPLAARFARAFAGQTYVLGYRLAPEHPYPAAIDDTVAAWHALVARAGSAKRIAIAADSAGAGLALALAQKLREAGEALPAAFAFLSPWVDVVGGGASMDERAALDPIVSREKMATLAGMYLGEKGDRTDPLVSPIHADLRGLPPTLVHLGAREVEFDDVHRFVQLCKQAGVAADLKVWPDALHVFQMFPAFPEAALSIAELASFARAQISLAAAIGGAAGISESVGG